MTEATVKSPCISICLLDENDICEGCYRTADEITQWSVLSDDEKCKILIKTKERFNELNTHLLL